MRPEPIRGLEPARAPSRPKGVRPKRERRALSGFIRVISGVMTVVLIVMLSAGGLTLLVRHLYVAPWPSDHGRDQSLVPRASSSEIAERLEHEGVISSRWAFMINYLGQSRFGTQADHAPPRRVHVQAGRQHPRGASTLSPKANPWPTRSHDPRRPHEPPRSSSVSTAEENLTGEVTRIPTPKDRLQET